MSATQRSELLAQKARFDSQRGMIESEYRGRVVGCAQEILIIADTVHKVLAEANAKHPARMVYFEPIGFDII